MQPLPLQQWDESLDHVVSDMNGRPLNVHSLMANYPVEFSKLCGKWRGACTTRLRVAHSARRCRHAVLVRVGITR